MKSDVLILTNDLVRRQPIRFARFYAVSHGVIFNSGTFWSQGKRGIYDNMKTAVEKVSKGIGRIVNTRFFAMTAHYLFDPDFCNVASGWEKSVVEKNVQDSRRRIWMDARRSDSMTIARVP